MTAKELYCTMADAVNALHLRDMVFVCVKLGFGGPLDKFAFLDWATQYSDTLILTDECLVQIGRICDKERRR